MTGEETIIDNWISNGGAHEWAINEGYILKEDVETALIPINLLCIDLMNALQALKKDLEE